MFSFKKKVGLSDEELAVIWTVYLLHRQDKPAMEYYQIAANMGEWFGVDCSVKQTREICARLSRKGHFFVDREERYIDAEKGEPIMTFLSDEVGMTNNGMVLFERTLREFGMDPDTPLKFAQERKGKKGLQT